MPLSNLPEDLRVSDVESAADWIDGHGIPSGRKSDKHVIVVQGKEYPPPYLGQVAVQIMTGELVEDQGRLRAGEAMFKVFEGLGFKKIPKGSARVHICHVEGIVPGDWF